LTGLTIPISFGGSSYNFITGDKKGYRLWDHDNDAGDTALERYTNMQHTTYYHIIDEDTTLHQWDEPGGTEYTD